MLFLVRSTRVNIILVTIYILYNIYLIDKKIQYLFIAKYLVYVIILIYISSINNMQLCNYTHTYLPQIFLKTTRKTSVKYYSMMRIKIFPQPHIICQTNLNFSLEVDLVNDEKYGTKIYICSHLLRLLHIKLDHEIMTVIFFWDDFSF